jgi:hypothetical protein
MSVQTSNSIRAEASHVAEQLCRGFKYHDERRRSESIEAFAEADCRQFEHCPEKTIREASRAYVDALWQKDDVEDSCRVDGRIDPDLLDDADWSPVESAFRRRATLLGMDSRYAELSTIAWRRHKTGGDYWTPIKRAQTYELRAALQDPDYPHKPRHGDSGWGPEAARYVVGVELHDMRRWEEAVEVMTPYFERVLREHESTEGPS